jgi:hypothetical protein
VNPDKVVNALRTKMATIAAYYNTQADGFGTHGLKVFEQMGFPSAEVAAQAKDPVYPVLAELLKAGE